jgi:hypothetical protein
MVLLICSINVKNGNTRLGSIFHTNNLITNATKRFTMLPNPIVELECTTFETFITTKTI